MAATVDDLLRVAAEIRDQIKDHQYASGPNSVSGVSNLGQPQQQQTNPIAQAVKQFQAGTGAINGFSQALMGLASRVSGQVLQMAKGAATVGAFTVAFDRMIAGFSAGMSRFVSLANPAVVMRFQMAIDNAASAIGRILIPVMERFTHIIQGVGDAIESLSPQAKQLIGALTAGGGIAAVFGAIATGATLLVRVLGVWPALIGAVVSAFVGLKTTTAGTEQIASSMSGVFKVIGTIFEQLTKAVGRIMAALQPLISALGEVLSSALQAIVPLIQAVIGVITVLVEALAQVLNSTLVPALKQFADMVREVAEVITGAVRALFELLGEEMPSGEGYDPNAKRAQSVRQASVTDLRSALNRSYATAFGGAASNIPEKQLTELTKHTTQLSKIVELLGKPGQPGNMTSTAGAPNWWGDRAAGNFGEEYRGVGRAAGSVINEVHKGVRRMVDPLDVIGRMERLFD